MAEVIAVRYAEALFNVALEKKLLDRTSADIAHVLEVCADNPDLLRFFSLPDVESSQKEALVDRLFREDAEEPIMGLLHVLIRADRIDQMEDIFTDYNRRVMEYERRARAVVTSAAPLSQAEIANVRAALAKALQKEIEIDTEVDPSLIGGLVVRVGDAVFDNSIRSSLSKMSRHLRGLRIVENT